MVGQGFFGGGVMAWALAQGFVLLAGQVELASRRLSKVCHPFESDSGQKLTIGYQQRGARYRSTYQNWMLFFPFRASKFCTCVFDLHDSTAGEKGPLWSPRYPGVLVAFLFLRRRWSCIVMITIQSVASSSPSSTM